MKRDPLPLPSQSPFGEFSDKDLNQLNIWILRDKSEKPTNLLKRFASNLRFNF